MDGYEKALALYAELAEALNGHSIAFAYHSGKMENENVTYHDTREIFEHDGVTSYTGDLRTLFEIRNAKKAYELFLAAFRDRRPVDEVLVKEFQQKLTQNTYDTRRYQLGSGRENTSTMIMPPGKKKRTRRRRTSRKKWTSCSQNLQEFLMIRP